MIESFFSGSEPLDDRSVHNRALFCITAIGVICALLGALGLGAAYGTLSGSCTFGFIAPILAVITVQQQVARDVRVDLHGFFH